MASRTGCDWGRRAADDQSQIDFRLKSHPALASSVLLGAAPLPRRRLARRADLASRVHRRGDRRALACSRNRNEVAGPECALPKALLIEGGSLQYFRQAFPRIEHAGANGRLRNLENLRNLLHGPLVIVDEVNNFPMRR